MTLPLFHRFWLVLLVALPLAGGCAAETGEPGGETGDKSARIVESDLSNYWVRWSHGEAAVPFNEYTELEIEVFGDESLETPAAQASIEVDAEVVQLGKNLPTSLEIESSGPGAFTVRGVLLDVPREWEFEVTILEDGFEERAVFVVDPTESFPEGSDPSGFFTDEETRRILNMSPETIELPEVPSNAVADSPAAAKLGQALFFEEGLSGNGEVACATCHAPDKAFGDGLKLSEGIGSTPRHAPTVLNAAFNEWQFWDGRVDTLWAQALQPFEAAAEHGTSRVQVVRFVWQDPELRAAYEALFEGLPDMSDAERFPEHARPVPAEDDHPHQQAWEAMSDEDRQAVNRAYANIGKSIEAYERKVVSLNSPFDQFAEGLRSGDADKLDSLDDAQKRGLKLYLNKAACDLCHAGPMMTNHSFHNLGLRPREWMNEGDEGRLVGAQQVVAEEFSAIGEYSDHQETPAKFRFLLQDDFFQTGAFKTPTLRNVARTAPYMHGGHHATLEEVVEFYSDLQEDPEVGRRDALLQPVNLEPDEVADLVGFLEALDGEPIADELTRAPDSL